MTPWTDANGVVYTLEPDDTATVLWVTFGIARERGMDRDAAWEVAWREMEAFERETAHEPERE